MKIAYLVFAYSTPRVLQRSIEALSDDDCEFFIHIDQKSSILPFSQIKGENIHFSENRISVYWGEFSGVQAILQLIREALRSSQAYDYFVLLSGSEYPLQSSEFIHNFLKENIGAEFISLVKMPCAAAGKPISRINTLRVTSDQPIRRFATRALAKVGLARRDYREYLGNLDPYAGNTWWALTGEACRYISEFAENHRYVDEYFKYVFAPEEMFFHTILGNSAFRDRVLRNLVYEDWSARAGHPAPIAPSHIKLFESNPRVTLDDVYGIGEALFARKFSDENLDLLLRIDEMIEEKEKSRVP